MSFYKGETEAEIYGDFEDRAEMEQREYHEGLISREEAFREKQLEKQLSALTALSNSISELAKGLINQKPAPTINIFIDKDSSSENINNIFNILAKTLNNP